MIHPIVIIHVYVSFGSKNVSIIITDNNNHVCINFDNNNNNFIETRLQDTIGK